MLVVVHHTNGPSDATLIALKAERVHHRTNDPYYRPDPLTFEVHYVRCHDRHDYGDSLARLWEAGDSFINLEHDVAPWPGALTEMWKCELPWCAMPLIIHGCVNETNLGCVKFSREFIERNPDVWKKYPRNDIFDWRSLDSWLYQQVPYKHHRHGPPALHMNVSHL